MSRVSVAALKPRIERDPEAAAHALEHSKLTPGARRLAQTVVHEALAQRQLIAWLGMSSSTTAADFRAALRVAAEDGSVTKANVEWAIGQLRASPTGHRKPMTLEGLAKAVVDALQEFVNLTDTAADRLQLELQNLRSWIEVRDDLDSIRTPRLFDIASGQGHRGQDPWHDARWLVKQMEEAGEGDGALAEARAGLTRASQWAPEYAAHWTAQLELIELRQRLPEVAQAMDKFRYGRGAFHRDVIDHASWGELVRSIEGAAANPEDLASLWACFETQLPPLDDCQYGRLSAMSHSLSIDAAPDGADWPGDLARARALVHSDLR